MKCKKVGCSNEVTQLNQVYCSCKCSPFGHMLLQSKHKDEKLKLKTEPSQKSKFIEQVINDQEEW